MAPRAYAQMQVVCQAVGATGGFDDASLRRTPRHDLSHRDGRYQVWGKRRMGRARVLQVQFQGISGHEVGQFRNGSRQIVVSPPNLVLRAIVILMPSSRCEQTAKCHRRDRRRFAGHGRPTSCAVPIIIYCRILS